MEVIFERASNTKIIQEAQDAVIELHEDDASAVRAMMLFIYDKPYTGACENEDDDLLFYVRVFMVADKYDLGDLKSLVCVDFNKIAPGLWDDDVFCEAVKEGYDLPAHGGYSAMNTIIEQICIRHLSTLTKKPTFMEACLSVPELTCKLLKVSSDNLERGLHTDKDRVSKLKECDERVRGLDLTISEKETKIKGLKAAVQSSKMPVEVAVECPKSRCQALISKCYWKLHRSRKQWKYRMPCPQCNAWLHESDEMGDLIYFYP